jgi:hypothetical protein
VGALFALVSVVMASPAPIAAGPRAYGAQQAGHGTLPTTGAAAPAGITSVAREQDPVLAGIEELRRVLQDTASQYKKAKDAEKVEKQRDLLAALARARVEVTVARELVSKRSATREER